MVGVRDSQGIQDGHVHGTLFRIDNQQGPTIQYRELCSMSCDILDARGVWGRMNTCTCMAESLCCLPETITTLIGYTPIKKKFLKSGFLIDNIELGLIF